MGLYTDRGCVDQQGAKLVGTGALGSAAQGNSVSLSSDGSTAIVGGISDNGGVGAAWVFTRSGGEWSQEAKLVGTAAVGNAYQGFSVSLASDGNTAIVGGPNDTSGTGAAWVFTRSGSVWSQQGTKLVGTGGWVPAWQGCSVSLSSDGNTAIVGGPYDFNYTGAAWVFTRSGSVWSQQGNKLVGTGAQGIPSQGSSVSLSSDGNTAIVGGQTDHGEVGAGWVYTRSGGVWSQQGTKLVGTGSVGPASQGYSVSLSSDGNTAIVGGYCNDSNSGAVWVFTRSGGVWSQQDNTLVGTGAVGRAWQGFSVSLSSDGNTAIVGGPYDDSNAGAAWVYTQTGMGLGDPTEEVPHQLGLEQNYPNPFNPSTTIRYGLPNESAVLLTVYNTLGQQVATLVSGEQEAEYHEVKFNGSDLSSGVYFYRLQAGDFVRARKLVLLR